MYCEEGEELNWLVWCRMVRRDLRDCGDEGEHAGSWADGRKCRNGGAARDIAEIVDVQEVREREGSGRKLFLDDKEVGGGG